MELRPIGTEFTTKGGHFDSNDPRRMVSTWRIVNYAPVERFPGDTKGALCEVVILVDMHYEKEVPNGAHSEP